ncbi:MAG: EFR1 family ferrodoxin [Candidatus Edwardsbacteria bacterium]|nr:EFR1 family ferrodoxin [Candidatus Edwardsbacteria bacterium]MBU2593165.1 EFR1 family ferrodoxin [Candidatus Edwardsbacteria bacterium]
MRACIVYFSQTGNTQKIAEAIQEQMAKAAGDCALLRLEEADPAIFSNYDLVGLGLPAFYFREPINVNHFFNDLPDQGNTGRPKPFFFFVTHGGTPGDVYSRIDRLAASRGLETMGFFQCLGVDTYPPFADRKPLTAYGHPDQNDLLQAKAFAKDVIHKAGAYLSRGEFKKPKIPGNCITRTVAGFFSERKIRMRMRQHLLPAKKIRESACTKCGLCVESCPQGIISLNPYPSIDESNCIACYHCQRICPTGAIDCDWRVFKFISGEYLRSQKPIPPID